jgi:hypothetical protein
LDKNKGKIKGFKVKKTVINKYDNPNILEKGLIESKMEFEETS